MDHCTGSVLATYLCTMTPYLCTMTPSTRQLQMQHPPPHKTQVRQDNFSVWGVVQEGKGHKVKEHARDTSRLSLGTRRDKQGSTGRCPRDFLLFPVIYYRKTDRKGHFCRDTSRASQGTPGHPGGSQKCYVHFSYVPFLLLRFDSPATP